MPLPAGVHTQAMTRASVAFVFFVATVFVIVVAWPVAQGDATDAQLEAVSAGRVIRLGSAAGTGPVTPLPLEVYVARVLAGEGEPNAPDAARRALAVAIRTFALANAARHARDGFDLCDGTHCQVPRPATAATRRATLATAGQVLMYEGNPAELFYSASCGGYSEAAADLWPEITYPYLPAHPDDVHAEDPPWTIALTLGDVDRALQRVGFEGRLRGVRVGARTASGRVARLQLAGLVPDVIAGDQFRAALGTTLVRSTAFSIEQKGETLQMTGRGYGHGVGMCVIGSGRWAARGETMEGILGRYYPGLALTTLQRLDARSASADAARERVPLVIRVPSSSPTAAKDLEALTARLHGELSRVLGVSVAPITVRVHDSVESFRAATGRPWWVSSVAEGTSIDLVPTALLALREGLEMTLRMAVADLLVSPSLRGRPLWIRVGAARYFGRVSGQRDRDVMPSPRCPSDAELTLAVSATAQREAEARAEACFAREYVRAGDWRAVR
jgi:stage II sporulation protein D (peptidoglycan lytic transglycosylase)